MSVHVEIPPAWQSSPWDCGTRGHVWLEPDGALYVRHNAREPGDVAVHCQYCPATGTLPTYSAWTAPPVGDDGQRVAEPNPPFVRPVVLP